MKILVVDDRPNLARVTSVALKGLSCETQIAATGTQAKTMLSENHFDAVFLDVNLGNENGFELLSDIVARTKLPVVMFTAQTKEEVADEAHRRGAFGYILKPFGIDDLRVQIERLQNHFALPSVTASHESR
ncbi:MAG: response regulator [Nibricoccus sp.]